MKLKNDEECLYEFYTSQIRDLSEVIYMPMIKRHLEEIEARGQKELAMKLRYRLREYVKKWRSRAN